MVYQQLSEYNGMKIGDIIGAYNNGFHKLLRIEEHHNNSIQFFYHQVATNEGKLKNSKTEKSCHADWCRPAAQLVVTSIKDIKVMIDQLEKFQELLNSGKIG